MLCPAYNREFVQLHSDSEVIAQTLATLYEIFGVIKRGNIMSEWMQYFTFSAAMIGAILGIINIWKSIDRDKIKLKVIPKHAIPVGSADPSIIGSIEVINLSLFTITLSELVYY